MLDRQPQVVGLDPVELRALGDAGGVTVLALAAPHFADLPRDQRLVAWFASQAAAAGDPIAAEQGYRRNLPVIRLLRGILSRPQVVPSSLLSRIRAFARLVYLNHGLHDVETGRKQAPGFTASELRIAALAASAAGADLGLGGARLELALRALEGPLFDARLDAQRTVHGADLSASAVNFYEGVTLRDLQDFSEQAPLHSRVVKQGGVVVERVYRLPAAADALESALPYSAPPQRAVFEPLAAFFRSGDSTQLESAGRAWTEAFGPVDAFAGFFDTSADPRGRKAVFGATAGGLPDRRWRELRPQSAATGWLSTVAETEGERVEDDRQRSVLLQLWWFAGKGGAVERHASGRRYLAVPDGAKFRAAAQELLTLLKELQASGDAARWRELLERHASRPDPRWREEIASRLQGVPRRVAVLPPRLEAVLDGAGKVVDAQAVAVQDFDEQVLQEWASY